VTRRHCTGRPPGRAPADLTGRTFGRLTALHREGADRHGKPLWRVRCVCGESWRVRGTDLTGGRTRSCGCLRTEGAAERMAAINARRGERRAAA